MKVRTITAATRIKPQARTRTKRQPLIQLPTPDLRYLEHIALCALLLIVGSTLIEQMGAFLLGLLVGFNVALMYTLSHFTKER